MVGGGWYTSKHKTVEGGGDRQDNSVILAVWLYDAERFGRYPGSPNTVVAEPEIPISHFILFHSAHNCLDILSLN